MDIRSAFDVSSLPNLSSAGTASALAGLAGVILGQTLPSLRSFFTTKSKLKSTNVSLPPSHHATEHDLGGAQVHHEALTQHAAEGDEAANGGSDSATTRPEDVSADCITASDCQPGTPDISSPVYAIPMAVRFEADGRGAEKALHAFASHPAKSDHDSASTPDARELTPMRPIDENSLPQGITSAAAGTDAAPSSDVHEFVSNWKPLILSLTDGKYRFAGSMRLTTENLDHGTLWTVRPHWELLKNKDGVSRETENSEVNDDEIGKLRLQLESEGNPAFDDSVKSERRYYLGSLMEGENADALRAWHLSIPSWLCAAAESWGGETPWHVDNYLELVQQKRGAEREWSSFVARPALSDEEKAEKSKAEEEELDALRRKIAEAATSKMHPIAEFTLGTSAEDEVHMPETAPSLNQSKTMASIPPTPPDSASLSSDGA